MVVATLTCWVQRRCSPRAPDRPHGRCCLRRDAGAAQLDHLRADRLGGSPRASVRPAGTVQQSRLTVGNEPVPPLAHRLGVHPEPLGGRGNTPPLHQQNIDHRPTLARRQDRVRVLSPTLRHEPSSRAVSRFLATASPEGSPQRWTHHPVHPGTTSPVITSRWRLPPDSRGPDPRTRTLRSEHLPHQPRRAPFVAACTARRFAAGHRGGGSGAACCWRLALCLGEVAVTPPGCCGGVGGSRVV